MSISPWLVATPAKDAELELLSDIEVLRPDGTTPPAIYPGQPFSIRWHYWDLAGNVGRAESITADVLPSIGAAIYSSKPRAYQAGGVSEQIDSLLPTASSVYRLGDQNVLTLRAGSQAVAGSMIETADYAVVPEEFWRGLVWDVHGTVKGPRTSWFAWKEAYQISAHFTNISPSWTIIDPRLPQGVTLTDSKCTLYESGDNGLTWTPTGSTQLTKLGPGAVEALMFPPITHSWDWVVPWVWYINGDTTKSFVYTVEITFRDDYNNSYTFRTPSVTVSVSVSDRKLGFAAAALALNGTSLLLYTLAWLIGPIPGGAAKTAADAFGKAAQDPPAPSRDFGTTVVLPRPKTRRLGSDQRVRALAEVIAYAECVAETDIALYHIESRILGAQYAKNRRAIRRQQRAYDEAVHALVEMAACASRAIDQFIAEIQTWPDRNSNVIQEQLIRWRDHGLKRKLVGGGTLTLPPTAFRRLDACVRSPQLSAVAAEGFEANLARLRFSLLRTASLVFRDRHRVLGTKINSAARKRPRLN
jgi:hypothetical protein